MSTECRDIEALLSPYADGELEAADAQQVEAHLATCASCRAMLESWRESETALASLAPVRSDVEWERLARRVDGAVEAEERAAERLAVAPRPLPRGRVQPWIWGGSGILAAAALVGLFWPWVVKSPETEAPRKTDVASVERFEDAKKERRNGIAEGGEADALASRDEAAASGAAEPGGARQNAPAPLPESGIPGVDVRRVAIVQEQKEQGMLSAKLQSTEGGALEDEAAPAAPPPPREAAPATGESVAFAASQPERGARTFAEMQDRFARLAEDGARNRTRDEADRAALQSPPARSIAGKSESEAALPAPSPAHVFAWAETRRAEGDALRAREAYSLLTGDFPGNDMRANAWFARADLAATEALRTAQKEAMERAAAEVEGFLDTFPADPHRGAAMAQRVRLWAAVAAQDSMQCARARAAQAAWQSDAGLGASFPDPAPAPSGCP